MPKPAHALPGRAFCSLVHPAVPCYHIPRYTQSGDDPIKNGKIIRFINISAILICMLVFLAGLARTVISPDDEVIYENRPAEKLIGLSPESFADQSFQDSVESTMSDQVNAAIKMKKLYNIIDGSFALPFIDTAAEHSSGYIGYRDVWFFKDMLVLKPLSLGEYRGRLQQCAESINAYAKASADTDFYLYYIETDKDIDLESGEKSGLYEYLRENLELDGSHVSRLRTDSYEDYSKNFLSTDHHWNGTGAYTAYLDICAMLGTKALPSQGLYSVEGRYLGTRAAGVEGIRPGSFDINVFDYPEMEICYNGNPIQDYGRQSQFIANELSTISYGMVFGEDCAELTFDTGTEGKKLLVMGDSYDNAILKSLACGFSKTYSIDLRAYDPYSFDLTEYVRANGIDTVLFVGGIDYFSSTLY